MAPKRSRSTSPVRGKRARINHVEEKLDIVLKYLKDADHCEVPGPASCREMLWLALPHAIGEGAASDERYDYQSYFGKCIGEVFDKSVKSWEDKVATAQSGIDSANKEKDDATATLEAAKKTVEDIHTKIKECKDTLKAKKGAESEAQAGLEKAKETEKNFDKEQALKKKQLDNDTPIFSVDFEKLKSGDFDGRTQKKHSSKVITLLKSLGVDKSLVGALPAAFDKKPAERGTFDTKAMEECEGLLKAHLDQLTERVNNGEALKKETTEAVAAAEGVLTAATGAKEEAAAALKAAEDELKEATKAEKAASKTVDKMQLGVEKAMAFHGVENATLQKALNAQDGYKFLIDRTAATSPVKMEAP